MNHEGHEDHEENRFDFPFVSFVCFVFQLLFESARNSDHQTVKEI